jgi:diguanylate cyclase (GGDEF)-like protein/PAS domain S-box-containing protein
VLRLPLPLVSFLAGGLVYPAAASLGLTLMDVADGVPAFWPANGLVVALALSLGLGQIGWVAAGALVGTLLLILFNGAGVLGLTIGASDMLEVVLLSYAAHRLRIAGSGLENVSSVIALIGLIAFGACISALGATISLHALHDLPPANTLNQLWRLNAISSLIVLAPYFAIVKPGRIEQIRASLRKGPRPGRVVELLAIILLILSAMLVMQHAGTAMIAVFTAPLLWCAIRFGPSTTALAGASLSLVVILLIVNEVWPTAGTNPAMAWQIQRNELALSFNTLPPLIVAAAMASIRSAAAALTLSQERLRYALAGSGEGVWDWNIATGSTYFSDGWLSILGYSREELQPSAATWTRLRHPEDDAENRRRVRDHLEGRTTRYSIEQRFRHKDGRWIWVLDRGSIVERDPEGRPVRAVGTMHDISRIRARLDELDRRAHHDPLTGLANRASLMETFAEWSENGRTFCFILIDLDDFKPINDQFGHQFGDHALVAIADRLRACLGPGDVAARIGGDEFALLVAMTAEDAKYMVHRLVQRISEPIGFADSVVSTGASIGIVMVTDGSSDFETAYLNADIALYDAKSAGGSGFQMARTDGSMRRAAAPPSAAEHAYDGSPGNPG